MIKHRNAIAALSLSAAGLVGIVMNEGYSDTAIIPVKGDVPTIGFGSTTREDGSAVKLGDKTTPPKALARVLKDISVREGAIKKCIPVPLTQKEYDLYLDFSYNVGTWAFCNSTMAKKLNALDYVGACQEFPKWKKFQGKDCTLPQYKSLCGGLPLRRNQSFQACMGEQL